MDLFCPRSKNCHVLRLLRGPALRNADAVEERLFSLMPMGTHKGMPLPE